MVKFIQKRGRVITVNTAEGEIKLVKGKEVDIYINKLNLCIEIDGSHWHKNKIKLGKYIFWSIFKNSYSY